MLGGGPPSISGQVATTTAQIAPYRLARRRPELRDGTVPEVERLGEPALRPGGILNRHVVLRPAR
jgi:hypothetical protein